MKAAQINQYGGPEVIQVNETDKPEVKEGYVLIEVHAASLNPFDTTARSGQAHARMPLHFPATLGGDVAGVVTEISEGTTGIAVGDEVYGQASVFAGGTGSFAEFTATQPGVIAKKPETLHFNEAASLPLVGSSAIQALMEHLKLQKGQTILIHGGAGGIGSLAVQLAKHLGAHVIATAATNDIEFVKGLGADEVVDYQNEKFEDKVSDVDAVFDTVAGETYTRSFPILKKGGTIVSMLEQPNQELMEKYGVTAIAQFTTITTEKLNTLSKLVDSGVIKPQVDKVFELNKVTEAFMYREHQHPRGKVVIEVKGK
ncbi:MAG TPA: NADP-dependent oxidoreductase [Patescibacteria group bacterium]